jgi:hypothetical protein
VAETPWSTCWRIQVLIAVKKSTSILWDWRCYCGVAEDHVVLNVVPCGLLDLLLVDSSENMLGERAEEAWPSRATPLGKLSSTVFTVRRLSFSTETRSFGAHTKTGQGPHSAYPGTTRHSVRNVSQTVQPAHYVPRRSKRARGCSVASKYGYRRKRKQNCQTLYETSSLL